MIKSFEIAPMDAPIRLMTNIVFGLPASLLILSFFINRNLAIPAVLIIAVLAWIWLWFRPQRFDVAIDSLTVVWPTHSRRIERIDISDVSLITRAELREKTGRGIRVGTGGMWGGFGWLYTANRGVIRMYISRVDRVVWFETAQGTPWIITPDSPEEFLRALADPMY